MKQINLIILVVSISLQFFAQENSSLLKTSTHLMSSFYHVGSYSKEKPFLALEQTLSYNIKPKIKVGLGTGLNIYPATLTIPIYTFASFTVNKNEKINIELNQSYGRNTKLGEIGFNSNRYAGKLIFNLNSKKQISLAPYLGYLFNWDKWGGKSLSYLIGLSIKY